MVNPIVALINSALSAVPFLLLWNWLMPHIFNLPKIDIFQAFGLLLLSYMIFDWG